MLKGHHHSKTVISSPVRPKLAREGDVYPLVLLQLLLIVVSHQLFESLLKWANTVTRTAQELPVQSGIEVLQILQIDL